MNFLIRIFLLALASATVSFADTLELKNGKILKGELSGRRAQYVSIAQTENQSEIEMRIAADQIVGIRFSDASSKQEAIDRFHSSDALQAASLLEPLVKRRSPYLDLLSESDQRLFVMLLDSYLEIGRGSDCLDQAKLWRTKLQTPEIRNDIEELQIKAAWKMQRYEEAAFYANRWIDSGNPASETTIAWNVLAENALEAGDAGIALWTALNPIVFSVSKHARHLPQTYEIAIVAAYRLGYPGYAQELLDEMRSRNLVWPIASHRSKTLEALATIASQNTERSSFHPLPISQVNESSDSLSKLVGLP